MDVSPNAAELICDHVRKNGEPGGGFRIHRDDESLTAEELKIGYVHAPMPRDVVVTNGDARVFVAADATPLVDPYVLDARKVGHEYRLFLRDHE